MIKCLFICTISPKASDIKTGGANLTRANYQAISEFAEVTLMHTISKPNTLWAKIWRMVLAFWGYLGGNSPHLERKLKLLLSQNHFDVIFIEHSQLGRLAAKAKNHSPQSKLIVHFQNIETKYVAHSMRLPNILKQILKNAAFTNEQIAVDRADCLITLTSEDSEDLKQIYGRSADLIIPISVQTPKPISADATAPVNEPYILFCGSFFPPNVEAVEWFVANVLDHIDFTLVVIGFKMEKLTEKLSHPRLKILGTVEDVATFYRHARWIINPVRGGAGMNSKSVEALAFGKPLLATTFALRGFPRPLPSEVIVCDSSDAFIGAINRNTSMPIYTAPYDYFTAHFTLTHRKEALSECIRLHKDTQ